ARRARTARARFTFLMPGRRKEKEIEVEEDMNDTNTQPAPPPPPAYSAAAMPAPPPPAPAAPPVAYATPTAVRKRPGIAGLLSMFPGGGHVYLGLYQRGVVFFAIWAFLITMADHVGMPFGLMIPFWMLFVLIDAVRQANAINATGAAESNIVV